LGYSFKFEDAARVDPRLVGEQHPGFSSGRMWIYQSPPLLRLPQVEILYEIDDENGVVTLWSIRIQ
jgi:hypothetical protein